MNPFVYSQPVSPEDLIDREREVGHLVELAEGAHATRLAAPRRYGKTSLLYKVAADARAAGMACVYVDFTRAVGLSDVAVTIENAYRHSLQGPAKRALVAVLRTLKPRLAVAPGGVGAEIKPALDSNDARRLGDLLDLPLALHRKTGQRTLVIFDEFQELLSAEGSLDALVRSRIQHHGQVAAYIYAGSRPGFMRELFSDRERPLFGQARAIEIEPLSDADIADYVGGRFAATGREVGDVLDPMLDVVNGHPQRAMMFAHHLWELTAVGESADATTFAAALDAVRAEAREALEPLWGGLTHAQRAVILSVAEGLAPLATAALARFDVPKTTARQARDDLLSEGFLLRVGSGLVCSDPLLADFVRGGGQDAVGG